MDNPIYLTSDLHEIGYADVDIDFEVGTCRGDSPASNDFEFADPALPDTAGAIYINGTEFGGIIEYTHANTEDADSTYKGWTWRGLLDQCIICPDDGDDYKIVSGDINDIIAELTEDVLGGFFTAPTAQYGTSVTSYQFTRYCSLLEGLERLCEDNGARLYIHADKPAAGEAVTVTVEAAAAETISGSFDDDSELDLTYTNDRMGINHLICLGQGDLAERERVDLYIGSDGSVGTTQYYTGFDERTDTYDYSNAESTEDLTDHGSERLLEIASSKSMGIEIPDDSRELEVGDIAAGTFPDGTTIEAAITKKIVTITGGTPSITYTVEGEQ